MSDHMNGDTVKAASLVIARAQWGDEVGSDELAAATVAARDLNAAGLLAPAPLREVQAETKFGEMYRRWATDWEPVDGTEGDGSADQ